MSKVEITIRENGDYLYDDDESLECILLRKINSPYYSELKEVKLVLQKIKQLKDKKHPTCILYDLFYKNVSIDFQFAKDLKLYDNINHQCFTSKTKIGKALIHILSNTARGLQYILFLKTWQSADEISLEFILSHDDYVKDIHCLINQGKLDEVLNWRYQ